MRLARISNWCFDHRIGAVALWVAALAAIFGVAGAIGPSYDATFGIPGSDSDAGFDVLEEHFPDVGAGALSGTIVFRAEQGVDAPEVTTAMDELFALVEAGFPDEAGVAQHPGATVISPYTEQGEGQIAREGPLAGEVAYAQVNLAEDVDITESALLGGAIADHAPSLEGLEVVPGGSALAEGTLPQTELIGLAFAVLVLIVAFGSVLAMGLPVSVALGGVAAGSALTLLLSNVFTVPEFTAQVGAMIGLGVGIDYALFIVTRFRRGTHDGLAPRAAMAAASDTAGRAVILAGVTVVVSLLGLLVIGIPMVSGVAIGASTTVLATMITSLTLLPALLSLAGKRLEVTRWRGLLMAGLVAVALFGTGAGLSPLATAAAVLAVLVLVASVVVGRLRREVPRPPVRPLRETAAYRWSRTIQRSPWRWFATAAVALLVLASPVVALRLGVADESTFPEDSYTQRAYELLSDGFGQGFNGPLVLTVLPGPGDTPDTVAALERALTRTPGVAAVSPPVPNRTDGPGAFVVTVVPTTPPQAEATTDLVTRLREDVVPAAVDGTGLDVNVTGAAAADIDLTDFVARRAVVFYGVVLALSFLLLMVVFRSVLVPLKAVVMNALSMAATYGVVVAVFQWGWGASLSGVSGAPIEPFMPLILFAIVFGLSMDYEVFLLSRMREEYVRTGDPRESVADGLASTARVITAAAAIMIVVFGSFALEDDRLVKMLGTGLAVAVLLDVTLVRMVLVPATMELLGEKNWWMPAWLDRILPRLSVERPSRSHDAPPPAIPVDAADPAAEPVDPAEPIVPAETGELVDAPSVPTNEQEPVEV